jgi:uncharacterized protein YndB with AHSA1/START domain
MSANAFARMKFRLEFGHTCHVRAFRNHPRRRFRAMAEITNERGVSPAPDKTVVISRLFDAPRDLVFEAWTTPEYLLRWFAPHGCAFHIERIDVRPGGGFHSCIRDGAFECWCIGDYQEIVAPSRLVYTLAIADRHGNKIPSTTAGHDPRWPAETRLVVTFEDLDGHTRLTLRQNVSESLARQTGAYPSWIEMLERLEMLLLERSMSLA